MSCPELFYVGRFLTGLGGGGFALVPSIYISETAETSIRGSLGSIMPLMMTIGYAFINALGIENAVDWVVITGICLVPPGTKRSFKKQMATKNFSPLWIFFINIGISD
jgi:MFS family permease